MLQPTFESAIAEFLSHKMTIKYRATLFQVELAGSDQIAQKITREELLTPAEWWYYTLENSENFEQKRFDQYRRLGVPQELESLPLIEVGVQHTFIAQKHNEPHEQTVILSIMWIV
jgi:hypothetical protein